MENNDFSFQGADGSDFHLAYLAAESCISKLDFTASYKITKAILEKKPRNISFIELHVRSLLGLGHMKKAEDLFCWLGENIYKTASLSIAYFDFLAMERRHGELFIHVWDAIRANQSDDLLMYFNTALGNLASSDLDFISHFKNLLYSDLGNPLGSILISFNSHLHFESEFKGILDAPNASLEDLREQLRKSSEANLESFLASNEQIVLPAPETPQVTVIIVLWNQAPLTLACLQSLAAEVSIPIEVVIVDNASTDRTSELLARVQNANILHQSENVGFLRGVNAALSEIRGGHVLLLNNDATLRHGTLAAAVETMNSAADVGAVGGPIILPNGALQEAGSIIWRDGSCLGYGRHDDPSLGSYMFYREVDYCSGAFLMIRDGLFQKMGGFDEIYAPAYYEETDLCMRIRDSGYRILYDPRAAIDHFEFGSLAKKSTAHEWQSKNREKFREKHAHALATQHLPPAQENILAARMRNNRPSVLFIEDRVPLQDLGAGLPRTNEILQAMVNAGFFVTFLPSTHPNEEWSDIWSTVPQGVEVATKVGLGGLEKFLEERAGYYKQIFISRPHNMAKLVSIIERRPELTENVKIIYDAEAIFASRTLCKADLLGDKSLKKTALIDRKDELALATHADHITAVNAFEAESFRTIDGPTVTVLGHTLPIAPTPARFEHRSHIVFLGNLANEDSPNVDSYVWFVDEVMPLLGDLLGDQSKFLVAGRNSATSVHSRQTKEIELLGPVPDLETLFDQAKVFVAPTRYAAGIPLKVLQAASLGVPIVATPLLARQLGWEHEKHLLVANTAEAFASAIQRLFADAKLWMRLREAALQKVSEDCNPQEFRKNLLKSLGPENSSCLQGSFASSAYD